MLKKFVTGLCFMAVLVFGSTVAHAVPSLGVGTGTFECTGATEYWECFSGNLDGHAFALPASGATDGISPFTNITDSNIWLLAEPSIGSFTFNGVSSFTVLTAGAFASYDTPYQGVNLGQVDSDWTEITSSLFNPAPFYMLPGTLTYTGTDVEGDWLFLVADIGNNYPPLNPTGKGHDTFSPKTTSAVGIVRVPEPGMLLLFGAGLIGLPFFGRKFKKT